jgi:hypothetical protein
VSRAQVIGLGASAIAVAAFTAVIVLAIKSMSDWNEYDRCYAAVDRPSLWDECGVTRNPRTGVISVGGD